MGATKNLARHVQEELGQSFGNVKRNWHSVHGVV